MKNSFHYESNIIKILIVIALLLFCASVFAQAPTWQWAKKIGGNYDDQGHGIARDANGNLIVTGYFNSTTCVAGTSTLTNAGNGGLFSEDIYVAKLDASGNFLWARSAGGKAIDQGQAVATDANGNIFVTGYFESDSLTFGSITIHNKDTGGVAYDIFVVKYDPMGNAIWARSEGGHNFDLGYGIATDAAGDVIVTGYYQSDTLNLGSVTLINSNVDNEVFVLKYDAGGNLLWAHTAGGMLDDYAHSVAVDATGNVLIAGFFGSDTLSLGTIDLVNDSAGSYDIFLAKYNAAGNLLWARSAGTREQDAAESITTDAAGNIFVSGYFTGDTISFGSQVITNPPGYTGGMFLAKYDPNGNAIWAKAPLETNPNSGGNCVATDSWGNVFVAGFFYSPAITFGTITLTNPDSTWGKFVIAKYDANGNVLDATMAGTMYETRSFGVVTDGAGGAIVTGIYYFIPVAFGAFTLNNSGFHDNYIAKWSTTTGVMESPGEETASVYPNPCMGDLYIKTGAAKGKEVRVELLNMLGEKIFSKNETAGPVSYLDVSGLASGTYFVNIRTSDAVKVQKIIVQK